jgi:hypothetical protein
LFVVIFRAGELSAAELDNLMTVVANPRQFKVPDWFLNRKKDYKDGKFSQVVSNALDMKLRDDLERLKKIRYLMIHCSFRHSLCGVDVIVCLIFWRIKLDIVNTTMIDLTPDIKVDIVSSTMVEVPYSIFLHTPVYLYS